MNRAKKFVAAITLTIVGMGVLGACGLGDKYTQPYQDAGRTGVKNTTPADVVEMPDGFSNLTSKCDHGNRLYVAYHANGAYAAVAVSPQDPSCK